MKEVNPINGKGKNAAYEGKQQTSTSADSISIKDRLGFANRNLTFVNNQSKPTGVKALGANYLAEIDAYSTPVSSALSTKIGQWQNNGPGVAGVCALAVNHIFGYDDPLMEDRYTDIFSTYWTRVRTYYTGGKYVSGVDLQLWMGAVTDFYANMHNMKRILKAISSNYNSAFNKYIRPEVMPAWFGFRDANIAELDKDQILAWISRYNHILSRVKSTFIPLTLIPGFKRWASLYGCAFKDENVSSDYSQHYTFYPAKMYVLEEREIPGTKSGKMNDDTYKAKIKAVHRSKGRNISGETGKPAAANDTVVAWELVGYSTMYNWAYTTFTDQLNEYFRLLEIAARNLSDDASSIEVLSIIQQVLSKAKDSGTADSCDIDVIPLDFMTNDPEPMEFIYDFPTLLSIHNATIMTGIQTHSMSQEMPSMLGFQQLNATANSPSAYLANLTKPLDLLTMDETNNDFINATQWTVVNSPTYDPTTATLHVKDGLAYGSFKTEVISSAYFLTYSNEFNEQSQNPFTVNYVEMFQLIPGNSAAATFDKWNNWNQTYYHGYAPVANIAPTMFAAIWADFRFAPMLYTYRVLGDNLYVNDIFDQSGCLYIANFSSVAEMNRTFVENFWGCPFVKDFPSQEFSLGSGNAANRSVER